MTTPVAAVAGSPNAGKTSLFNQLTGARQKVGNWPGQTVEKYTGRFKVDGSTVEVVDLPGAYGLVAVSEEEAIAATFLAEGRPDVVVTVVDSSNLTGSLHLAAQIAEAGVRQVIALNMVDVAERRGIDIDETVLADRLGVEVVRTVARRGTGIDELKQAVLRALERPPRQLIVDYGPVVERHLGGLVERIIDHPAVAAAQSPRWSALQLLAGDRGLRRRLSEVAGGDEVVAAADDLRAGISAEAASSCEMELAEHRFNWIAQLVDEMTGVAVERTTWSDRIDRVLTNRYFGIPIFLAMMWVVLRVTADVSAPFLDWIDATIAGPIARWFVALLDLVGLDGTWVESMVVDGVLAGVGGVLVFVPVLFSLYLCLAILEDTGYMARAAAVMDRAMRAVGIPGKAFLPMMVGFGCTVPAIYATRTLDSSRDRLLTGLITPFMSCGARLPVYVLLAAIFFAEAKSTVVFGMYVLGIMVAVLIGLLLSRTALREEEPTPFVMVMPEFRLPNARTVWMLVWQRTMAFVKGAGTTILLASMAVWLLLAIPVGGDGGFADTEVEESAFGVVAEGFAPVLEPAGFGEWEQSGALLSGFVAKEVVVSTMAQLYAVDGGDEAAGDPGFVEDLSEIGSSFVDATLDTFKAIPGVVGLDFVDLEDEGDTALQTAVRDSFEQSSGGYGSLAALAFMVFVLLYTPCMAAVGAFRHEFGTKWMWVSVIGQFLIAWAGAMIVFQGGRLLGLG
ncbi:MAG: ferrous iron transport protein B [Acidimicrobiia bacterium]|nr:ferrous iron transport protein B [Acidimicrobiia bacterium]